MPAAIVLVAAALALGLSLRSEGLVIAALLGVPLAWALQQLWTRVAALETELAALRRALAAGAVPLPFRPPFSAKAGSTVGAPPRRDRAKRSEPGEHHIRRSRRGAAPTGAAPTGTDLASKLGIAQPAAGAVAGPDPGPFELPDLDFAADPWLGTPPPAARPRPVLSPAAPGPAQDAALDAALAAVRGFFTDGNLVVRAGILILFLGVAFLLKYAADHSLIPLSLRLGGAGLGGLVLLGIGWHLRHRRRLYALLLQGAGVGVTFLTAFAAVRLFGVLDPLPALVVMVALVAATGFLAVAQDAPGLAGFGVAGGFLAPVLVSTGGGSHVALFSYYALLNLGVFGIAWFKSWKALNLEGFLFTFGLGTLWGSHYYRPGYFASVEPFLLLDFALYLGVAILFALRQPPRLRGLVDGTLVFGLPLAVFALQGALVADTEYGLAWTALGLGLTYGGAAAALHRFGGAGLRLLVEAFLALAVAFLTISVPLALDGHWTSALWAAEGAALVWVGLRQGRVLARWAGLGLQVAAGLAFLHTGLAGTGSLPVLNADALGLLILALAGLFSSRCLERGAAALVPALVRAEAPLTWLALAWGGAWWLALGWHEADRFLDGPAAFTAFLTFLAGSGLALGQLAGALGWVGLGLAGLALLPLLWGLAWVDTVFALHRHPLVGWNGPAWALALGAQWWLLYRLAMSALGVGPTGMPTVGAPPRRDRAKRSEPGGRPIAPSRRGAAPTATPATSVTWPSPTANADRAYRFAAAWPAEPRRLWHGATLWLALLLLGADLGWWGQHLLAGAAWAWVGWALPALLVMAALVLAWDRLPWPVLAYPEDYRGHHLVPVALGLGAWSVLGALTPADPGPLTYVPLLNPLALTQGAAVGLLWAWSRSGPAAGWGLAPGIGLVGLAVLTGWVAQGVHHLGMVPYRASDLFDSTLFQATLSLVWGLTALTAMWLGNRRGGRPLWIGGALLLGLVVAKLFVADLAGTGTVARIVSFIGVGLTMLTVGYLAPLPPREGGQVESDEEGLSRK